VAKTFHAHVQKLFFFFTLTLLLGCSAEKTPQPTTTPPQITADYLLKHRIIAYAPRFHETVITTLPYEIKRFKEEYLLYLVARIPDPTSNALLKPSKPRYYLWLERRSDGWLDFTAVHTPNLTPLTIASHFSAIRQGRFYKEYTIDFTLEQLYSLQSSGLELSLINKNNETSSVTLPKHYIVAFLKMLEETSHR
jgi:hypothetical protein